MIVSKLKEFVPNMQQTDYKHNFYCAAGIKTALLLPKFYGAGDLLSYVIFAGGWVGT